MTKWYAPVDHIAEKQWKNIYIHMYVHVTKGRLVTSSKTIVKSPCFIDSFGKLAEVK